MLIDNKSTHSNYPKTLIQFISKYISSGNFDIVTGFFSVSMLAYAYDHFKDIQQYRMILGNLIKNDKENDQVVNLFASEGGFDSTLNLSMNAKKAVEFLKGQNVAVKTVKPNFCHAKTYIFEPTDNDPQKGFFVLGSSNFTDAGLGLRDSSNVELNMVDFAGNADFKEIKHWFGNLWTSKEAKDFVESDGKKIAFKDYLIENISQYFKEYSPEELYYKLLFELFKEELIDFDPESIFSKEIEHLRDTVIYNALYPFQQKGVLSLIQKLRKFNGAILADAVGLGKTWEALAVMKYFELQGFRIILFCPKKLEHNWRKFLEGHDSKFERDKLKYTIRYHTDLQDERIENHDDKFTIEKHFQSNPKILVVIDESHNLRNDKSSRYQFLVEQILDKNRDVKVLLLSATPINTKLSDIRNQFKLIARGNDKGFASTEFNISSLQSLFATAQKDFAEWQKHPNRKIADFINKLPQSFFSLSDSLIVARTRDLIKKMLLNDSLVFPQKESPINLFDNIKGIGKLESFDEILDALQINLTAYRPAEYTKVEKVASVLEDERQRQKFLVKMMYILMVKRLESSWFAFKLTIENIFNHHKNALKKVEDYISGGFDSEGYDPVLNLEKSSDIFSDEDESNLTDFLNDEFTIGKKNPIHLSQIVQINEFHKHLNEDVKKLEELLKELGQLNYKINEEIKEENNYKSSDTKLEKLIELIHNKQQRENKKVLIFSVYKDTVKYLFNQLKARGFQNIAFVSGDESRTDDGYSNKNFEPILERFAPFTKLYREKDWSKFYSEDGIDEINSFDEWKNYICSKSSTVKNQLLNPIEILIATDCLSEGQNLQDCDFLINYDIHWNPVRIIQRMGRIDRLSSPNKSITGVNFWPGKSFDDFLRLKNRVEGRMALLSIVGAEIDTQLTEEMKAIIAENPLITQQEQKLLNQLQIRWDDLEGSEEIFGFDKLSLESFRQELLELYLQKRKELEAIPIGVFTGFKNKLPQFNKKDYRAVIGILGAPRNENLSKNHKYEKLHLFYCDKNIPPRLTNDLDILNILRAHKTEKRFVPEQIEEMDSNSLSGIKYDLEMWLDWKSGKISTSQLLDLFNNGLTESNKPKDKLIEDEYSKNNFDLITWFIMSN